MIIFKRWADSLSLLAPSSFKLFLLVTLKSVLRVYRTLFLRWWPLVVISLALIAYNPAWFVLGLKPFFFLFFLLLARPSVQSKELAYMLPIALRGVWLLPLFYMMTYILYAGYLGPWIIVAMPLLIFYSLAVLDSYARPTDVIYAGARAGKMFFYNVPFCLLTASLMYMGMRLVMHPSTVWLVTVFFSSSDPLAVAQSELVLIMPLPICFFTNFYTKKIYEQFNVYR